MELGNLRPAPGSVKTRKRVGRGQGSGLGGTCTRGHKGDKSRSGARLKRNFEGGQTPLQRRLPKRGFKNIHRVEYVAINLDALQKLIDKTGQTTFDVSSFVALGLARKTDKVKILGRGNLSTPVHLSVHAISASAKNAIEAVGGSVQIV
ncbi:MAG: 50S ribosomal protein L15 [Saprospiraceae bacterium]|nr:50S ribosomal protein L15 [Saprospiraceae bacterium]MDW8483809.1 50S ribosomal protein L15 [Saprospiraceae bacterium]